MDLSAHESGSRYGIRNAYTTNVVKDVNGWAVVLCLFDDSSRRVLTIRYQHDPFASIQEAVAAIFARTESAIQDWLVSTGRGALIEAVETEERWKALLGSPR